MKQPLPSSILSLQDLTAAELEVKDYARWFAHNSIKERTHAKGGTPPPIISPASMELIKQKSGSRLLTQASLDELVQDLAVIRQNARTITVTLAAPAPTPLKQAIAGWCRQNIAADIFVNFQFNSGILGGIVIRYNSRIMDWSFRRKIMDNRAAFPKVLSHV